MEDQWNFDSLLPLLGPELLQYTIRNAPILSTSDDAIFWNLAASGKFSLKTAWELVRQRRHVKPILSTIWATPHPTNTKILIWR